MKFVSRSDIRSKLGTTALALCLLASNTAALARCASPQEMVALKVAALRQQLMVAALTCHQATSFNHFIISYQEKLQISDRELMRFFVRQDSARADDAYNAYKTRLANDSSLRSLHDPWFCGSARTALRYALERNATLAELVSDQARPIQTGFESCMADGLDADAVPASAPESPARHRYMLDSTPTNSQSIAAPQDQLSAVPERQARLEAPATPKRSEDVAISDSDESGPAPSANDEQDAASYYRPYAYNNPYPPPYAYGPQPGWWYPRQAPMQQVMGPDGRWYLVPGDR